jgi:class 3 adenylate cyclase/MFS family permease
VLPGNRRARRFYEAAGWVADGAERSAEVQGVVVPEVRYRRRLSQRPGRTRAARRGQWWPLGQSRRGRSMRARTAARLAWWLCAAALAMMAARLLVVVLGATAPLPPGFPPPAIQAIEVIGFLGAPILGGVIAAHRPENPYGWLWCAIGLTLGVTFLAVGYGAYTLVVEPGAFRGGMAAAWVSGVATAIDYGLLPFVFLLVPDGRLPSDRWRWVAWTAGLIGVVLVVLFAVGPEIYDFPFVDNPVRFAGTTGELVDRLFRSDVVQVVWLAYIATLALSAVSMAVRFRRARGQERQQLKWLAVVGVAVFGFFVVDVFVSAWEGRLLDAVVGAVLFSALYAAIGIAVLRHRLYDIDLLLTRTLAYGLLTAAFTVVYLAIVVGIGTLAGSSGKPNLFLSIVATAVIAVAFQPARDRSRRLANRLVYGRRATPYEVLSGFSRGVAGAATDESLQRMARLVVEATGARQATVWLRLGDALQPQARWPKDGPVPAPVPLQGRGVHEALAETQAPSRSFLVGPEDELLGALTVTISPAEPLTVASEKLITDLATQTGLGLRFQRMRERALFARALASFLPPEVAELVQASPTALSLREELEATILFSDIRGFSSLAERLPPRQVAEVVGRHLTAMVEVVTSCGGVLDKFAGDAVMAVFGAPRPVADHARRALACAAAMQHRQLALNNEAEHPGLPAFQIGIGVNTGTVIAGTLGGPGRLDYTVLGDAVNIAQRLQSEAVGGEILASAITVRQAGTDRAEPVGRRRLKGRQELVDVYRIDWAAAPTAAE